MEETKKEKENKPFNVVLLGNIESEKASLLHKLIKKRFYIKQLQEIKNNEENDKMEDSNIDDVMNIVEIHGETIKMKIWDNVSANKIFSSSNKGLKIAQGVILFYSVADRKSFNILKMSLSRMIDFDKYDIPMLMVGSDSETPKRQVTYEEAKSLADSYGIRFHETSINYGINDIFEDIGEQVFYEKYGNNSNNNKSKKKKYIPKCKSQKNLNKTISIYSSSDFYKTDFKINLKRKIDFKKNVSNLSSIKKRKYKSKINLSKANEAFNSDIDIEDSSTSYRKNKKKKKNISNIFKSPESINKKILNSSPSSILLSYQGKTEATKKREEEIRERRLKKEKEMKSWWEKREREKIENKKKRKKIEKEELEREIKEEEQINKKEKKEKEEKKKKEEKEEKVKEENNIKDKSKNKKRINKLEKSKRLEKISYKRNDNENSSILKEEKQKSIKIKLNNKKNNVQNRNNKFNNTDINFYKKKNENKSNKVRKNKFKNKSQKKKNSDNLENSQNNTINDNLENSQNNTNNVYLENSQSNTSNDNLENSSIISEEIIKQNTEIRNKFIEMYKKNSNIYRCLKCRLIPNIIFNEYNQEIEIFCDKSFYDQSHHNITTYSNFQDLSLNHPIDSNNVFCYYCNKAIKDLPEGKTIYYCCLCDIYYCTEDEELHKNERHKYKEEIKKKYLKIFNKKKKIINSSSQNTKKKTVIKQKSKSLLKDINNNNKKSKSKKGIKIINNIIINEKKEKRKIKNENKVQIFLMDSFCANHYQIFKYYCYNCHRNICDLCESEHEYHNKIKLEDILLEEDELIEKKNKLNKEKEELIKIYDYFYVLMEEIKRKFDKLYNIKQKELYIKEKIIKDYETIKYNFHSIENVHNLKFNNNFNIDKSNNSDWFHKFNLIFKNLNSSLNNKNNDIFDLLNNRNENNIKIISNNDMNEINKLIILKNEDIAISNNNKIKIYDKYNLEEKLNINIFKNNSRINNFIEKEGGGLLCAGYEYINYINLSLNNKFYHIENIIYEKNTNLNSIIELNNNYIILLNNNNRLELWENNYKRKKYELIDNYYLENKNDNLENNNLKEENNSIFKINYNSFILSEKDKIKMFKINNNNKIKFKFKLDNIKLVKGNNSIIKLLDKDYILLSCYEYKNNILYNENEYNSGYFFNYSIKLIDINNFKIIENFNSNHQFIDMSYYIDNIIIVLDSNGIIYKFELDKYQQKLFLLDKIYYKSNKISSININKNKQSVILNNNDKIIIISSLD